MSSAVAAWHHRPMTRRSVSLFRRIERALETIAHGSTPLETIRGAAHFLADSFASDLGLRGGRIYAQDDGSYELVTTFGEVTRAPVGLRVARHYPPFEDLMDVGVAVMRRDDPRLDPRLETELGTRDWFAAISVADGLYALSFDVEPDTADRDGLVAALNIVRLAINQKLRERRMSEIIEEARRIQVSILPRKLPRPADFVLAARTAAAEVVGGDFYDVIVLDRSTFNLVVADATGHGLPAALQVRDVYTGLRMGLAREYKLTRTLERLNRIIYRSRLVTKFVSLIVAEIDQGGTVLYCNAGHPPALLVRADGGVEKLSAGGLLLGPMPDARYTIGVTRMEPGDLLAMYTDGLTEARRAGGDEEFGEERLVAALRGARGRPAQAVVDEVFDAVGRFSKTAPPEDDQTLLVATRQPRPAPEETP